MSGLGLSLTYLGWLVAFAAAAWLPPARWQGLAMSVAGLAFLAASAPTSLAAYALIAALALVGTGRAALPAVAALALIGLAYKGAATASAAMPAAALLGFSFAVLKTIHYAVDSRAGRLPQHTAGDFVAYLVFLPTLVVGPIVRYAEFHRAMQLRRWDWITFSLGLERVLFGYAKAIVVAAYLVNWQFVKLIDVVGEPGSALELYLQCLRYGLHLYFSFAGMSDIAIGTALVAGLRIPENFRNPFAARSIVAFWKSWHITLSTWCRDYVFMPVAAKTGRPALAVVMSMLVLGVWHELSARYQLWAAYHALGIVVCQAWARWSAERVGRLDGTARAAYELCAWFVNFNFVIAGFAITMTATPAAAFQALQHAIAR